MKKLAIVLTGCVLAAGSFAEEAGFQFSLVPDIALQDRDTTIKGVSLGVWNENPGTQWQIGLVNGGVEDSAGLQSFIPFLFFPAIFNYADSYTGAQLGIVNWTSEEFTGAQLGFVNGAGDLTGLQWGAVNYSQNMTAGVQLGWINYTETVTEWALQLGFVNIIADNNWFTDFPADLAKGFVFVNWSFGR
ncbi:hypothetical protein P4C99_04575 [Pontiellaceae bacterium B1224]|nr:hypothetical protein [Pontiellaceae bacterium B1224]